LVTYAHAGMRAEDAMDLARDITPHRDMWGASHGAVCRYLRSAHTRFLLCTKNETGRGIGAPACRGVLPVGDEGIKQAHSGFAL